jgi:heme oxygenase
VFKEQKKCAACGQLMYKRLKDDELEEEIQSTVKQIEDFMQTTLYADFKHEIDVCMYEFDQMLDDPHLEYTGRHYDLFRGAKYALLQSLNLFERLLGNKIADMENEEESKK